MHRGITNLWRGHWLSGWLCLGNIFNFAQPNLWRWQKVSRPISAAQLDEDCRWQRRFSQAEGSSEAEPETCTRAGPTP